jgi:hypothetical protein
MKRTDKTANGTSFHDHTFTATVDDLRNVLGKPKFESNDGQDKCNFDWIMETEDGTVFTVYDWKEYRQLAEDEVIEWHIGGRSGADTEKALLEMREALMAYTL